YFNPIPRVLKMPGVISERVLREMEAAILSGGGKPREHLVDVELIDRYGVSRTIIREALKKLEDKGLVRIVPHRGARVADLSVREIEEIYFVRAEVEKIAARLLVKNIQPAEIESLKKLAREVESHLRHKTEQMIEKDGKFHRAVYQTCRNQHLCDLIDHLKTKAYIVGYNAWSLPQRIEESIREHQEIVKAIAEKNAPKLERLIVKHLTFSKNSYLEQLRGNDRWPSVAKEKSVG
ncbi:MAG: GntR family transcriptional regulator, partial [Deltaproteobacteria bacterium]|nr:GntR family transcriptional regulator [Deltaproteobacteria bacterium]